jgi:hypothetical protein
MPKKDSTNLHKEKRGLDFRAQGFQQVGGGARDAQARPIGASLFGNSGMGVMSGEYPTVRTSSSGDVYNSAGKSMGVVIPFGMLFVLGIIILISR